jgi:hypothetical protein
MSTAIKATGQCLRGDSCAELEFLSIVAIANVTSERVKFCSRPNGEEAQMRKYRKNAGQTAIEFFAIAKANIMLAISRRW